MIGALSVTVLSTVLVFTSIGAAGSAVAPGPSGLTMAEADAADGIVAGFRQASDILGLIVLGLFAYATASEFSLGTLRNLLIRQPDRVTLMLGKWLALSAFAVALALLTAAVSALVATAVAPGQGVDTGAWQAGEVLSAAGSGALALVGFGTLGLALGLLLRAPVAAVGLGAVYLLPLETIIASAWDQANQWLPGRLLGAILAGGNDYIDLGSALVRGGLLVLVAAGATLIALSRRDVTD